jgi:hypothetical protein
MKKQLGHAFSIAVLVEVFDILSASLTIYFESKSNEEREASSLEDSNVFGNLDIEESMLDDEVGTTKPRRNAHRRIFGPENSEEYLQFDISCFNSDFNHVRTFLKQIWECYRDGTLDIMVSLNMFSGIIANRKIETVFIVTDIAFDLLERAKLEFERLFPHENGYSIYEATASNAFNTLQHSIPPLLSGNKELILRDRDCYPIAQWFCILVC